jgi:hypothetical protein
VGTDDGNVQVTRDGGRNWEDATGRIDGVPEGTWVPQVRASKHDAGEAFVVFDDHRRNNWEPYLYRTRDYGRSWERLAGSDDVWGYALSIEQDPVAPGLLFLGTEFGLYFSLDDGATWTQWTNGMPTASVMDLVIHPRDHDLVVGTFGRSVYILDDIRPLRALAQRGTTLLDEPLVAFEAPPAYQAVYRQAPGTRFAAEGIYTGENRPRGAMITYSVNPDALEALAAGGDEGEKGGEDGAPSTDEALEETSSSRAEAPEEVKIEILDDGGAVIRTFDGPAEAGINRAYWEMSRKGVRFGRGGRDRDEEPAGASVLPGTYTARINYGEHQATTPIQVEFDPRVPVNRADLAARLALYDQWEAALEVANEATERIRKAREAVEAVNEQLGDRDDDTAEALKEQGKAVQDSLTALEARFSGEEGAQGIRRDPGTVQASLSTASSYIQSGHNAPDPSAHIALEQARTALGSFLDEVNRFFAEDWPAYRQAVDAAQVSRSRTKMPTTVAFNLPRGRRITTSLPSSHPSNPRATGDSALMCPKSRLVSSEPTMR